MQTFYEALTESGQKKFKNMAINMVGLSWSPVYSQRPKNEMKLESQEDVDRIMRQKPESKKELESD